VYLIDCSIHNESGPCEFCFSSADLVTDLLKLDYKPDKLLDSLIYTNQIVYEVNFKKDIKRYFCVPLND